jgi:hypothetical protein
VISRVLQSDRNIFLEGKRVSDGGKNGSRNGKSQTKLKGEFGQLDRTHRLKIVPVTRKSGVRRCISAKTAG